jgi:hypothetical protein
MVEPAPETAGEHQPEAYSGTHLGGCGTRRARPGSVARPCTLECGAPRPKGELTHPVTSSARQQEQLKDQSKRLADLDMRFEAIRTGGELRGKRLTGGRVDEIGLRGDQSTENEDIWAAFGQSVSFWCFLHMPKYWFTLDNGIPHFGEGEVLADDAEARKEAEQIARDIGKNRTALAGLRISVLNEAGDKIHEVFLVDVNSG